MSYQIKKNKQGTWLHAFDINKEPKGFALITELKPFKPKKRKSKVVTNKVETKE